MASNKIHVKIMDHGLLRIFEQQLLKNMLSQHGATLTYDDGWEIKCHDDVILWAVTWDEFIDDCASYLGLSEELLTFKKD